MIFHYVYNSFKDMLECKKNKNEKHSKQVAFLQSEKAAASYNRHKEG